MWLSVHMQYKTWKINYMYPFNLEMSYFCCIKVKSKSVQRRGFNTPQCCAHVATLETSTPHTHTACYIAYNTWINSSLRPFLIRFKVTKCVSRVKEGLSVPYLWYFLCRMAVKDSVQDFPKMGFNMLQSCPHVATLDTNCIHSHSHIFRILSSDWLAYLVKIMWPISPSLCTDMG